MKIGIKLAVIISAVNLVCIGGLTVTSLALTSKEISLLVNDNAGTITEVTANKVRIFLEVALDEIRAIAILIPNLDKAVPVSEQRKIIDYLLHSMAEANPDFVGVWAAFEPNALDGMDAEFANAAGTNATGRYAGYFSHVNGRVVMTALEDYDDPGIKGAFYHTSLRTGHEAIIDPYYYDVGGKDVMVTSVTVPVRRGGRVIGVVGIDMELTEIQEVVMQIRPFGSGQSGVFSNGGRIIAHPDPLRLGKNMEQTEGDMIGAHLSDFVASVKNGRGYNTVIKSADNKSNTILVTRPFTVGNSVTPWTAAALIPESVVMAPVYRMIMIYIILGIAILLGVTILILIVSQSITAPLKSMEKVLEFIGEGDFTHNLEAHSKDEIGNISHSLNATVVKIKNLLATIRDKSAVLSDLGNELATNMNQTASAVHQITGNIQSIKGQVINQSASVTETNATMEQITVNINKLNSHVERQSGSVVQSSSAIEEMIANIQSVTQTLIKNMDNVNALTSASEVGRTGLQDVAEDIREIARESEGLLEINEVMQNIASQTNLLSMNAAIEAAHAGEAGKGFAVVADEIRKLAENSSEQSKTISNVLKKITGSINKITTSTENVLGKFQAIDNNIRIVTDQEGIIRNAMEEQGQGSKQVLDAISNVNDITRQVKSGSIEMLDGSKEVIQESKNLGRITEEITGGMNEMVTGADQILIAVNRVNDLSLQNHKNIDDLLVEVSRFRI